MKHFNLCHLAKEEEGGQEQKQKGCVSKKMAKEGFEALDTNEDGSLSYEEIKVGIDQFAKSQNHTLTDEEWAWIKTTGEKIDSKTPGKVDE